MRKIFSALAFTLILFTSCSKDSSTNLIIGTWIFTKEVTNSFAYPSSLTNPFPIGNSSWSTTTDSIKITFDNSGNYTFYNFRLPVDKGKYAIAQDSFLIINPKTSDFLKFNYTLPFFIFSPTTNPLPVPPYNDFHFTTDTILIKESTINSIVFSGVWIARSNGQVLPGNDTLIKNYTFNTFKRQ